MESTEETRALAQKTLDYIHSNPEGHDQRDFFPDADATTGSCGTTMCIAGTALAIKHNFNFNRIREVAIYHPRSYEGAGGDALGLNEDEAQAIFYDMDNERALQKLKKVVVGEGFTDEDYEGVEL